jgi:hypothetical protein
MIPVSFSWDTQKGSISLQWNGFFSFGWKKGKALTKILGSPILFGSKRKKIHFPMRRVYLKEGFSFLSEWKVKNVEGTFSFSDPMVNGILYGWMSAIQTGKACRKINVTINFLGENRCSGEAILPLKSFFQHLKRWVFLFLQERRGKRS